MRNFYFAGLILIIVLGCNSSKNNENAEIIDTIKNHQLGALKVGDPLDKVIEELKNKYIIQYDSVPQSEEDTLYFYHYAISDKENNRLYELNTKENKREKDVVNTIMIYSNQFVTEKGIRVGDKILKLKSKYSFEKAYFNYDDGLWLYFKDFNGAFRLNFNEKGVGYVDIENPDLSIDSIPEQIRIDGIVVY